MTSDETDRPLTIDADECRSCGSPSAPAWDTSDGRVRLCQPCAVLHGVGCP